MIKSNDTHGCSIFRHIDFSDDFFFHYLHSNVIVEIIYGFVKLTLQMYVAIDIWRFRQQSHHQDSPDIVVSAPSPVQTYSTSPPPPYGSIFTYHLTHLHPPPYSVVKV